MPTLTIEFHTNAKNIKRPVRGSHLSPGQSATAMASRAKSDIIKAIRNEEFNGAETEDNSTYQRIACTDKSLGTTTVTSSRRGKITEEKATSGFRIKTGELPAHFNAARFNETLKAAGYTIETKGDNTLVLTL